MSKTTIRKEFAILAVNTEGKRFWSSTYGKRENAESKAESLAESPRFKSVKVMERTVTYTNWKEIKK